MQSHNHYADATLMVCIRTRVLQKKKKCTGAYLSSHYDDIINQPTKIVETGGGDIGMTGEEKENSKYL